MLDRFERPLKIACLLLGVLVLVQAGRLALRRSPLDQLKIPALPTLSTNTTVVGSTNSTNVAKGSEAKGTNATARAETEKNSTNAAASQPSTNQATNVVADKPSGPAPTNVTSQTATNGTNVLAGNKGDMNPPFAQASGGKGTNASAPTIPGASPTNLAAMPSGPAKPAGMIPPGGPPRGMGLPPGAGGPKKIELPPTIQARVDKITQSEILAAVVRPLPMALLGIAGNSAFLRSPSGQSGVVKEGDKLGDLTLLKIGTNRVLVEVAGEKKELMVFSGFGGESLLPKEKEQKETPK